MPWREIRLVSNMIVLCYFHISSFRYLSHRFHGKGSGKLKTEKRRKKLDQEQVCVSNKFLICVICLFKNIDFDFYVNISFKMYAT